MVPLPNGSAAILRKGRTPEEIRKAFNVKKDFTPSDESQIFIKFFRYHKYYDIELQYEVLNKDNLRFGRTVNVSVALV